MSCVVPMHSLSAGRKQSVSLINTHLSLDLGAKQSMNILLVGPRLSMQKFAQSHRGKVVGVILRQLVVY